MTRALNRVTLTAAFVSSMAVVSLAQQSSTTTEVKTFEVLAVDGNTLVVNLPEGTRELTVADDFRFNVDGKMLSVRELKPGTRGSATITTRTTVTPVSVTEVKNGTVMQAGGGTIVVRTADGGVRMFTQGEVDKRGVKIMRMGKPAQVSDFRTGDTLSATIITAGPPRVMTEKEVQASTFAAAAKTAAAAAPAAAAAAPSAAASAPPAASAAPQAETALAQAATPRTLPRTASSWPLFGFVSASFLALGLGLTIRRRFAR
jgi:hypothetical protein